MENKGLISTIILIILLLIGVVGYNYFIYKVPAGNVGVKVNLLGSDRGVDNQTLSPGRYFISINQELYTFPTFTQNEVYKDIGFQTRDGLTSWVDIGLAYSVSSEKANVLFQKYRKGINEITEVYLSNMIRDAFVSTASKFDANVLIDSRKDDLLKNVEDKVRQQVQAYGINIERIFWYGSIRLPKEVQERLIQIQEARQKTTQRDEEVKQVEAEARKKLAEAEGEANALVTKAEGRKKSTILRAEGEAQANNIVKQSLTNELMQYNIQQQYLNKWNGTVPTYQGGNGNVLPILPLTK